MKHKTTVDKGKIESVSRSRGASDGIYSTSSMCIFSNDEYQIKITATRERNEFLQVGRKVMSMSLEDLSNIGREDGG